MNNSSAILEVEKFLKEFLTSGEVKNNITGLNLKEASKKEIAQKLGEYLTKHYKNFKIPRVYQFLEYTQKPSIDEVEDDLNLLLKVISHRKRDLIEKVIDKKEYRVELFSSVGLRRLENQDYLGYLEVEDGVVLIVADGVGGGESGEIASKLVVESVIESFEDKKKFDSKLPKDMIKEFLKEAILRANEQLVNFAQKRDKTTMATTLSLTLILNKKELYIAHVGDSRVYELKDDREVIQRTPDHSVREVLYRSNKITKEEKEQYKKNILAYVVGKSNLKPENIFIEYSILYSDSKLLLCSDGFWEKIDIDKNTFNIPFNALKEQIYSKIPTDNVTVIRYFPKHNINPKPNLKYEEENSNNKDEKREEPEEKSKRGSYSLNNHFSNRKFKNRVFKKKRYVLIAVIIVITIVTFFSIKYIL